MQEAHHINDYLVCSWVFLLATLILRICDASLKWCSQKEDKLVVFYLCPTATQLRFDQKTFLNVPLPFLYNPIA